MHHPTILVGIECSGQQGTIERLSSGTNRRGGEGTSDDTAN
jgi:hypothetical protein